MCHQHKGSYDDTHVADVPHDTSLFRFGPAFRIGDVRGVWLTNVKHDFNTKPGEISMPDLKPNLDGGVFLLAWLFAFVFLLLFVAAIYGKKNSLRNVALCGLIASAFFIGVPMVVSQ